MVTLEQQAMFLVTKYGTALGPVGVPPVQAATIVWTPEAIMVLAGLVIFGGIVFAIITDALRPKIILAPGPQKPAYTQEVETITELDY